MTKKLSYLISLIVVVVLLFSSCVDSNNNKIEEERGPIVSVRHRTLYQDDLDAVLLKNLSPEDSALVVDAYIKQWIEDELMYDKAKRNIVDGDDIEKLVHDYRQSLIVHSYKDRLLKDKLAQEQSEAEVRAFYDENKQMFILEDNIVKGLYLKIPIESSQLDNFRKWYTESNEEAISNIEKNTLQNVVGYEYFYDRWLNFDEVMNNIPYAVTNSTILLKTLRNLEVKDSSFVYLLNLDAYKLEGDRAPFEFVEHKISDILLAKKRSSYLERIQQELYDKALADEEIKFHNK